MCLKEEYDFQISSDIINFYWKLIWAEHKYPVEKH